MKRGKHRWNGLDALHKLADLPQEAAQWVKGKVQTVSHEKKLLASASRRISLHPSTVDALKKRLQWKLEFSGAASAKVEGIPTLSSSERKLLEEILLERDTHNRNNVTRTEAYLQFYTAHPELHWAFLAHMVSRNGGWSMTDLKGDLLPHLLNEEQCEVVFSFLERANALIFNDAYPQLLLYQASLRHQTPLFHLLPYLGVSYFMRPVWDLFWERRESALVTVALIVNEQHFIEKRVVQHPTYQNLVINTLFFQAQSILQLNQVVFPYTDGDRIRLAGQIVENFSSVQERIEVGKKLYGILFGIPAVHEGCRRFALSMPHSGSRSDYWPELFATQRLQPIELKGQLQERLDGCRLRPGAKPLYSPRLEDSRKDRKVNPPEPGDWFTDLSALGCFKDIRVPFSFEMTQQYCSCLNKIELATLAGDLLFHG